MQSLIQNRYKAHMIAECKSEEEKKLFSLQKSEEVKFFTDQVRRALGSGNCLFD